MRKVWRLIRNRLPESWQIWISIFRTYFFRDRKEYGYLVQWLPRKIRNGNEHADKRFFVIRNKERSTGLLSCYLSSLGHLPKAKAEGLIPVFDMQTCFYQLVGDKSDQASGFNSWEHYFTQPTAYHMADVRKARNVEYSLGLTGNHDRCFFDDTAIDKGFVEKWHAYDREYIHLLPELRCGFEKSAEKLLSDKRVLGTMIREGYMVLAKAKEEDNAEYKTHPGIEGHPIQPTLEELADSLKQKLIEWRCDYLFVVCETEYVLDYLKKHIGADRILVVDRDRKRIREFNLAEYRKEGRRMQSTPGYSLVGKNTAYLEEIYLLSRCTALYASKCSGSIVAAIWNGNTYENMDIILKGIY